ncbi:MAG TPA: family 65 glycosyl hydrolase domain-containing protein, partial [Bacteroidales bacterium]|nr:family 65 glycosyl hydrolase domain-containing protein [Bacteroidales bacterium]
MNVSPLFDVHEWQIVESQFDATRHKIAESIFSIGNGHMGQRANFEEAYSGKTLPGNYVGGVFYPDKTRVGWWKNGYPDYFAKVLNAPNWIGIHVYVNGELCDLAKATIHSFKRVLHMKEGTLYRKCEIELSNSIRIQIESTRFISMHAVEVGAIEYIVTPLNTDCTIRIESFIDADVHNEDANYNEQFWESISQSHSVVGAASVDRTKKTIYDVPQFTVATAMNNQWYVNNKKQSGISAFSKQGLRIIETASIDCKKQDALKIIKLAAQISSLNYAESGIQESAYLVLEQAVQIGFKQLLKNHIQTWAEKWKLCDITIKGDTKAQQGIRFNIFQLQQTYTGADSRLNIGPKGFTGEKYGGSTYWDTEAFCLPFYLATSPESVAKQLLLYRYKQLDRAIANAQKLGFSNGAALYPMVTMTGDECHNEWEITFEEIHRNGAIAYAIYNYVTYTGDKSYLVEYGLEVLIAISRFWTQRVTLSPTKRMYMILGVTGPNEYENNVSNNWYTNYFARWCLQYTLETISWVKRVANEQFAELSQRIGFDENFEVIRWTDIIKNMYLPEDVTYDIILQQDGYLDKDLSTVQDIPADQRPINQHWSWDRILRSCYIKQADVVQGLYVFEQDFDSETITRNFNFYEARCVHESSLSPCIHSVVASKIGNVDK